MVLKWNLADKQFPDCSILRLWTKKLLESFLWSALYVKPWWRRKSTWNCHLGIFHCCAINAQSVVMRTESAYYPLQRFFVWPKRVFDWEKIYLFLRSRPLIISLPLIIWQEYGLHHSRAGGQGKSEFRLWTRHPRLEQWRSRQARLVPTGLRIRSSRAPRGLHKRQVFL